MVDTALTVTKDEMASLERALGLLTKQQVLVGIPASKSPRPGEDVTNVMIGYMNEFGSPAQGIPARPHVIPGIKAAQDRINNIFKKAATNALSGRADLVLAGLMAAGQVAADSIRRLIQFGLTPPLAESTLRARAGRGRKGAAQELANRAAGKPASSDLAKPLWDTGEYKNAITFVVRDKNA